MAAASRAWLCLRPCRWASSGGGGSRWILRQPPASWTTRSRALGARRTFGRRSRSASRAQIGPLMSRSPATYARANPSSPGEVMTLDRASGVRTTSVAGASSGPERLPSYASTASGRSPPKTSSTNGAKAISNPHVTRVLLKGYGEMSAIRRVIERRRHDGGRGRGAADVHRQPGTLLGVGRQERQRDPLAQTGREVAAGHDADRPVAVQHHTVGPGRPPALDHEAAEPPGDPAFPLGGQ